MKKRTEVNQGLSDVSSRYGAPMGRPSFCENPTARCRVYRLSFVSYDYDRGGAYWGSPANVYRVVGEGVEIYVRAPSRAEAKKRVHKKHPQLCWVN